MSDSSLSNSGAPRNATLEQALRNAVQQVYKRGNLEDLTVRRIRKSVEGDLDLQDDFFKGDPIWNKKSKSVIQSEVDAHPEPNAGSQQAPSSPPIQKRPCPPRPNKSQDHQKRAQGTKRASTEKGGPKKRRKKDIPDDQDSASNVDEPQSKKTHSKAKKRSPSLSVSLPPKEEEVDIPRGLNGTSKNHGVDGEHSGSEMSELIDEAPKSKGRDRKSGSAKPKSKKAEISKAKRTPEQLADPDGEEIKRLQGWLVKCGIRKVWGKELAPYDIPKTKISHLKDMLAEAGMTGRFSLEKANQIKEERELRADLEAVQEGNKHWGKPEIEEDRSTARPRKRLARGLEGLDFLNDDDGEETD